MSNTTPKNKSSWMIGGCLLVGMGCGFFFLQESALAFVGCLLIGLGVGLVLASVSERKQS